MASELLCSLTSIALLLSWLHVLVKQVHSVCTRCAMMLHVVEPIPARTGACCHPAWMLELWLVSSGDSFDVKASISGLDSGLASCLHCPPSPGTHPQEHCASACF